MKKPKRQATPKRTVERVIATIRKECGLEPLEIVCLAPASHRPRRVCSIATNGRESFLVLFSAGDEKTPSIDCVYPVNMLGEWLARVYSHYIPTIPIVQDIALLIGFEFRHLDDCSYIATWRSFEGHLEGKRKEQK